MISDIEENTFFICFFIISTLVDRKTKWDKHKMEVIIRKDER